MSTKTTPQNADDMRMIAAFALGHYGMRNQITKAIEELAELIVQLAKFTPSSQDPVEIVDEIADVSIMLESLRLIFGNQAINARIVAKYTRLVNRINVQRVDAGLSELSIADLRLEVGL